MTGLGRGPLGKGPQGRNAVPVRSLEFVAAVALGLTFAADALAVAIPVLRLVLGCYFVLSGSAKLLQDSAARREAVIGYQLVPPRLGSAIAAVLPSLEVGLGLTVLTGLAPRPAAVLMVGLLAVFSIAVAFDLRHGRRHDCGCLGQLIARPITWGLVVQNVFLAGGASVVALGQPQLHDLAVWQVLWSMGDDAVPALLTALALVLLLVVWPHVEATTAAYSVSRLNPEALAADETNTSAQGASHT
jgi:uncharacterized membrane protein YphA (DoxX/SURF4 family)